MQIAARGALLDGRCRQLVVFSSLNGQEYSIDHIARALVVDDAARPELGNREKARAL
jgi:hypothetical protein